MQLHDFYLAVLVAAVGAFNAWQNVNIKLAISQLRNELCERVSVNEQKIAIMKAVGDRRHRDAERVQ